MIVIDDLNDWVGCVGGHPPVRTPGGDHPLVDWGTYRHRDQDKGDWRTASWAAR